METSSMIGIDSYVRMKMEIALVQAKSELKGPYKNEYVEHRASEIFARMVNSDFILRNKIQYLTLSFWERASSHPIGNPFRDYARQGISKLNIGIGSYSTFLVYEGGYYKWNEVWHQTKTRGTAYCWESRWKKNFSVQNRAKDINTVSKYRKTAGKLTKASGVLLVADIAISGEIRPSHAINGAMIGVSTTGVGSIVAAIWFAADMGTMGINLLISGEAKGLGDIIDEGLSSYCYRLY